MSTQSAPNLRLDRGGLPSRLYRNIGWSFLIGTALLAGAVVAFSFGWTTILITPRLVPVSASLKMTVAKNTTSGSDNIAGQVEVTNAKRERTTETGAQEIIGKLVEGKVVLINTTGNERVLIPTTRLLAPDEKIYRIRERVRLPPKGEIETEIYADLEGPEYEREAGTKFTIPGLSPALQKVILAENREAWSLTKKTSRVVSEEELEVAKKSLLDEISRDLNSSLATDPNTLRFVSITKTNVVHDAQAGARVSSFTTRTEVEAAIITLGRDALEQRLYQALEQNAPSGHGLHEMKSEAISVQVTDVDVSRGVAAITVSGEGVSGIRTDHPDLDKKRLTNKNREEIEAVLRGIAGIEKVEFRFSPPWMKRTSVNPSRIRIQVVQ